ncbi:MAG: chemotaxis protein CheW [Geopsychrobacter sp.]|nr:chemotaxis protein CheW [Geopsychrobacter sp.]
MIGKIGLFHLQGRGYAVPLGHLLRVVDNGYVAPLPLLPAGVAGMLVLENQIIPLLDSDWLSGVPAGWGLRAEFKVLVATEYGSVALPADQTVGIVAESRCLQIDSVPRAGFMATDLGYCGKRYQVLNLDLFNMSLVHP